MWSYSQLQSTDPNDYRLPAPKEPWGPPRDNTIQPKVAPSEPVPYVRLQTPPPSPAKSSTSSSHREPSYRVSKQRAHRGSEHRGRRDMVMKLPRREREADEPIDRRDSTSPGSSRRGSRRGSSSTCRGKELRQAKQVYWALIEEFLVALGGLDWAKELHGGNKKSSNRQFEELDLLQETSYLFQEVRKDERTMKLLQTILRVEAWQRRSS